MQCYTTDITKNYKRICRLQIHSRLLSAHLHPRYWSGRLIPINQFNCNLKPKLMMNKTSGIGEAIFTRRMFSFPSSPNIKELGPIFFGREKRCMARMTKPCAEDNNDNSNYPPSFQTMTKRQVLSYDGFPYPRTPTRASRKYCSNRCLKF